MAHAGLANGRQDTDADLAGDAGQQPCTSFPVNMRDLLRPIRQLFKSWCSLCHRNVAPSFEFLFTYGFAFKIDVVVRAVK